MIYKIHARPGRDHEHWQTWAEATAALRMGVACIHARQRTRSIAAASRPGERVRTAGGLVYDRAHLMVVPAVGIVIGDHDSGIAPFGPALQKIDDLHGERLFVQWIRITRMSVLIRGSLQKTHGRKIAGFNRVIEVVYV